MQDYAGVEIVSTYGAPQAEYAAVRKSAALFDWPQHGVIEVTGKDRLPFLNNLLTNQTYDKATKTPLPPGKSVYAFLLNNKTGRIICDCFVLELGERTLLELDGRGVPELLQKLEQYRFADQVSFSDRRSDLHVLAVHGPLAGEVLEVPDMKPGDVVAKNLFDVPVVLWRDDPTSAVGINMIVPADSARTLWMNLIAGTTPITQQDSPAKNPLPIYGQPNAIRNNGIRPAGWAVFNATRIEGGRPMFGIDFDDTILPAETAQLDRAVSFTKGCYPGQEIVARMHARGQWAKQIVGLKMADDSLPIAGAVLQDDAGNAVGGITSSTLSPVLSNTAIAIALVKKPHAAVGTVLKVAAEGAMRSAVVSEMPFVKPA